jgi:hypothetical protein
MEIESFYALGHLVEKYLETKTHEGIITLYILEKSHTTVTFVHKLLEDGHRLSVTTADILATSHLCVNFRIAQCVFRWHVL